MRYILEHEEEFGRLEKQCEQIHYSLSDELRHLNIFEGARVLDAGCGSGILSRYLSQTYPNVNVSACDRSDIRLKQARNFSTQNGLANINFVTSSLESLDFDDNQFDFVICRYVYEYLPDPRKVTSELRRVVRPGGKVCLIDLDGVFLNMHSTNETLNDQIKLLRDSLNIDLFVGRKLESFLVGAGLKDTTRYCSVHDFQGVSLLEEYNNNRERLRFARPDLVEIFGTEKITDTFSQLYLDEVMKPNSTLFHNKFVAIGTK